MTSAGQLRLAETFAILAKRGSGKTYTAKVMVEAMHCAGPPVVVDPLGGWWGLRTAAADGVGDGLPFVIVGRARRCSSASRRVQVV